jgi:hypothetical protein
MTTSPAREPPGGVVIIHMDRVDDPGIDPNSTGYAVSFRGATAIAAVLLGRVEGLYALGGVLRKLRLTARAVETAWQELTEHSHYEISGVLLTPELIRELGL